MTVFAYISVPIAVALTYLPHVTKVFIMTAHKAYDNRKPRDVESQLKAMPEGKRELVARLSAIHNNQFETLGVFAGGVAAAAAANVNSTVLTTLTAVYIGARSVYIVAYAAPPVLFGLVRALPFVASLGSATGLWIAGATQMGKAVAA